MMLRMWFPQQIVGVIGVMVCVALGGGAAGQAQTSIEPLLIPRNATALEGVPASSACERSSIREAPESLP